MNNYKRVIQILSDPYLDYKSLCYSVAMENPAAIIKAVDQPKPLNDFELKKILIDMLPTGKVAAIKKHRELKGSSLTEAKDYVESLQRTGVK